MTTANLLGLILLAAIGCSASRPLRPVPRGQFALELSVPGVWFIGERTYPVGVPIVGVRHGLTDHLEATLRASPVLLSKGIVGLDAGATWHARAAGGLVPGVHLGLQLSGLVAPAHFEGGPSGSVRGAAALDATFHWEPWARLWPYVVAQHAVVLEDGTPVISAYAGGQFRISSRLDLSLELGVAGLNLRTRAYSQPYRDVAGHGALWTAWSLGYRL